MKEFFKYVGATVLGVFIFNVIVLVIGVMSIVGMIASGQSTKNISNNSVLVLNLSGVMEERQSSNPMAQFIGSMASTPGLDNTLTAIRKAKENDNIKGIYIEAGAFSADYASLQEIHKALTDFRKSGKWIIAYADTYTQGTYYLASTANKVYLNPSGQLDWHGLGSNPVFVKDLLAKFGMKMQIFKVGKYKSATEMFSENKMSDENREQVQRYINNVWENMCKGVAENRKISVAKLNELADNAITLADQKVYISNKLVDKLLYADQVKSEVKKLLKLKDDDEINQVGISDMINTKEKKNGECIAVYYAYGDIVDEPVQGMLSGGGHHIVGKDVCRDLEKLMKDDDIKAVVLRINSPGGSAYASEQLWHYIDMLKKKKPVVVSMGGYAASGGYYMSCNANWIVAEPTTLTGSIGIYGMIPDRSQLLTQKLGIKFDEVKTNKHAIFAPSSRPMNGEEISYMNATIARGYQLFRQRVADGRRMTTEQVEQIAQGHVFTGQDALQLKLVDQLGGLDEAIKKAAELSKLKEYYTDSYPAPSSWTDQLLQSAKESSYLDGKMREALGEYYEPFMLLRQMNQISWMQARLPFYLNIQ